MLVWKSDRDYFENELLTPMKFESIKNPFIKAEHGKSYVAICLCDLTTFYDFGNITINEIIKKNEGEGFVAHTQSIDFHPK